MERKQTLHPQAHTKAISVLRGECDASVWEWRETGHKVLIKCRLSLFGRGEPVCGFYVWAVCFVCDCDGQRLRCPDTGIRPQVSDHDRKSREEPGGGGIFDSQNCWVTAAGAALKLPSKLKAGKHALLFASSPFGSSQLRWRFHQIKVKIWSSSFSFLQNSAGGGQLQLFFCADV